MSGSVTAVDYGIDGEFKATESKQEGKAESYVWRAAFRHSRSPGSQRGLHPG
jgi:hypothetical protein